MKPSRPRVPPPIINFGKLRVDFPSRDRPLKDNLKFLAFLGVLLLIFVLLYQVQARWLTEHNARAVTPDLKSITLTP